MSPVMRKPVLGVCNQVRLKPACSADETSYGLDNNKWRYYTIQVVNNKGADQTARMLRLICTFVVCIWHKQVFSWYESYNTAAYQIWNCFQKAIIYVILMLHVGWISYLYNFLSKLASKVYTAIIRENFIFANVREFDVSWIQYSQEIFEYMVFTLESNKHRKFEFPRIIYITKSRNKEHVKIKCFK